MFALINLYSCWPKSLNLLCYFPHCRDARPIYNTLILLFSALPLFLLISASSRSPPNSACIVFVTQGYLSANQTRYWMGLKCVV